MGRDVFQPKQSDPQEMIWWNCRLMAPIHHLLVGWALFVLGQYWVWGLTGPSSCWDFFFFLGVDADVALPRGRGGLGTHPLCWLFSFMLWSLSQDAERRPGWSLHAFCLRLLKGWLTSTENWLWRSSGGAAGQQTIATLSREEGADCVLSLVLPRGELLQGTWW